MRLKLAVSGICLALLGAHLFVPALTLDAIGLGLIAIGLLPWFQPLLKSLELPGGLKIELQDVKSATDKLSEGVRDQAPGSTADAIDGGTLSFVTKVAQHDPNLALVGLRIEIEKQLMELAKAAGIPIERQSAASLLRELRQRKAIPAASAAGLAELIALGNQAAHGAEVSKEAAVWALDLAPQILDALAALRPRSVVTVRGEVPKSEVLGAFKSQSPVNVSFARPFIATPQISVGFESSGSPMPSGAVQRTAADEHGFEFKVLDLPHLHEVALWSLTWSATGQRA